MVNLNRKTRGRELRWKVSMTTLGRDAHPNDTLVVQTFGEPTANDTWTRVADSKSVAELSSAFPEERRLFRSETPSRHRSG
jgi:hypothetical protein